MHKKSRPIRKVVLAVIAFAGVLALALATPLGATARDLVTSPDIKDGGVYSPDLHDNGVRSADLRDGGVHENDLADKLADKLDPPTTTLTAATAVSDRADSGVHGNWATDSFTRTLSVTRHSEVETSNCGGGVNHCWFYTGTITDNGTFETAEGALSPESGVAINGTVSGSFNGGSAVEFYASTRPANAAKVPATVTGNDVATSDWVTLMFADDTSFSSVSLLDWSWTYSAPSTCEQWTNAYDGNSGDITGVNAC